MGDLIRKHILLSLCFYLLLSTTVSASVRFYASLDKTEGTLQDTFRLTLTVEGTPQSSEPILPKFPGFAIRSLGQSSSQQWVNGKSSSKIDFNYILAPTQAGVWTIPSAKVSIRGSILQSKTLKVTIHPPSQKKAVSQESKVFVEASLSSEEAYVNQQLLYTFKVFVKGGVRTANLQFEKPELKEFHVESLGDSTSYRKVIDGVLHEVAEFKLALYPLKAKDLTIGPSVLHGVEIISQNRRPWSRFNFTMLDAEQRPFSHATGPIPLKVKAFPKKGRPANFKGLVGTYGLHAKLSKSRVKVGDSVTITVTIDGNGRAEFINKPDMNLDASFKVYEDQPKYKNKIVKGQQVGLATFTMAIVPSKSGAYALKAPSIVYFNPSKNKYEVKRAKLPKLIVEEPKKKESLVAVSADSNTSLPSKKKKVKKLGSDLLPIHKNLDGFEVGQSSAFYWWTYGSLLGFAPLMFMGGFLWRWRQGYAVSNEDRIRANRAYGVFKKEFQLLKNQMGSDKELAYAVIHLVQDYVGSKSGKYGEALTPEEMTSWLYSQQVQEEDVHALAALMKECETVKYNPEGLSVEGRDTILASTANLIEKIDKTL